MARINVEISLFQDQRWLDLVIRLQDPEKALGALVRAWSVAQEYWKLNSNGIPKEVWKTQKLNDAIIAVGLAEDLGEFVKIWKSEKHFAWLKQRQTAGKTGGIKSGIARLEIIKETPKRDEAGPSKPKQAEASSSFSLSSSSSFSSSSSVSKKYKKPELGIRAAYSKEFEIAWEAYGKVGKKSEASKAFNDLGLDSGGFEKLLAALPPYIADCKKNERRQMYFATFLREDWREWLSLDVIQAAETPEQRKARIRAQHERELAEAEARHG